MIAVDTSALMAIVLHEVSGPACMQALSANSPLLISAGTLTEALIVSQGRHCRADMQNLIESLGLDVVPITGVIAKRVADAHARWGKGAKSAGLNFGDCFAYTVAKENGCPLLYIGRDFARTDIKGVL